MYNLTFYFNHIYSSRTVFPDFDRFGSKIDPPEVHLPCAGTRRWAQHSLSGTFKPLNQKILLLTRQPCRLSEWSPSASGASEWLSAQRVGTGFGSKCEKQRFSSRLQFDLTLFFFTLILQRGGFLTINFFFRNLVKLLPPIRQRHQSLGCEQLSVWCRPLQWLFVWIGIQGLDFGKMALRLEGFHKYSIPLLANTVRGRWCQLVWGVLISQMLFVFFIIGQQVEKITLKIFELPEVKGQN